MSMVGDKFHYVSADQFIDGLARMLDSTPYFRAGTILTPILLMHGDADSTFHSSELMAEALRQRNANFEFVPYRNMVHNISMWPLAEQVDLTSRIIEFFNKHLSN
jgi:dipeptidyl aminopeptidase/acylaminoacyl peptidase